MGTPYQHTSDITERCYINLVKEPYCHSNRRHGQCMHWLDRNQKGEQFQLYTSLAGPGESLLNIMLLVAVLYPQAQWLSSALPVDEYQATGAASQISLFTNIHSFISQNLSTAISEYGLNDLHGALGDYFMLRKTSAKRRGRCHCNVNTILPFSHLNAWTNLWLQQWSAQVPSILLPVRTVQALPPSSDLPYGCCNTVLISDTMQDSGHTTQSIGDECFKIVQICLIFSPVSRQRNDDHEVYCYVEDFKFSSLPEHMENSLFKPSMDINMFVLHHYHRTDRTRVGDIISLSSIREIVELVPIFGKSMPPHVNCDNSLELLDVFYLNNFVNKEVFHAILSYQ
ncbi:hypothetical protein FIBSPDRAFT_884661 [Athelia psychrophila]|uniref:DUF6830 domain-containing protein n=1 Tax=Athelia psychrophila TaxID=1759441 RepID=A0A166SZJ8_9AGAM|nr:hypothetical protein FIBSPDRAFT_884661 [Fibularhizoctonia sp. CBS 109695]